VRPDALGLPARKVPELKMCWKSWVSGSSGILVGALRMTRGRVYVKFWRVLGSQKRWQSNHSPKKGQEAGAKEFG